MATKSITTIPGETEFPDSSVTVTHYEEVAAAMIKAIEAVHEVLPTIEVPIGLKPSSRFAMVKEEFLATASGMYEGSPELQSVEGPDVAALREALQFAQAFRPVMQRLLNEVRHLELQVRARKVKASAAALQLYHLAKGVAQATPGVHLDVPLDLLKHQLSGPRKRKAPAAPSTAIPDDAHR